MAIVLASMARYGLDPLLGHIAPFVAYIPAVVLVALLLGPSAGLIATLLCLVFESAMFSLSSPAVGSAVYERALFVISGIAGALLISRYDQWYPFRSRRDLAQDDVPFRITFAQAAVGIAHVGLNGEWLRFNARMCEITGYSAAELRALSLNSLIHPDDLAAYDLHAFAVRSGQLRSYTTERRLIRKSGETIWISQTVSRVQGDEDYYLVFIDDVSRRRVAEDALTARNAELETLLNTAPVAIWFTQDGEMQSAAANAFARRLYGFDAPDDKALVAYEELPLKTVHLYQNGRRLAQVDELPLQRAARGEDVRAEDLQAQLEDGRRLHLVVNASPIRDPRGRLAGAVSILTDVTSSNLVESKLRESEERFRLTVDMIPDIVFVQRVDGSYEYINQRFYDLTGLSVAQVRGREWQSAVHPADIKSVLSAWDECVRQGTEWESQYRLRGADGSYRWVRGRARPIRSPSDGIMRWMGVLTDINDFIESAAALNMRTDQLQLALSAGRLGTWNMDLGTGRVSGDNSFWQILGFNSEGSARVKNLLRVVHPTDRRSVKSAFGAVSLANATFEVEFRVGMLDVETRWIHLRGRLENGGSSPRMIGVAYDATERRQLELARARETHQDFVIGELRHRIGNLFPVILSLVRLSAQHYRDVSRYQRDLSERLRALEAAHHLLASNPTGSARIEKIVRLELQPYYSRIRVKIDGPDLRLGEGAAESFAMIVHELATNSVKHGALSVPEGQLDVRWKLESCKGLPLRIVFEWIEENGPELGVIDRHGYGSFIIGLAGVPLMGESAKMEHLPKGLHYTLTIPYRGVQIR